MPSSVLKRSMLAGLVTLLIVVVTPYLVTMAATTSDGEQTVSGDLDGLDFLGMLKSTDGSISLDDTMHFRDGHFWSTGCTKCSFMPGAYWTRRRGEAIEFRGALESPERGRFDYNGTIEAGKIEATIHWRKERWYWTIDRDYVFQGRISDTLVSEISLQRARMRATGEAAPTCPI